MAEPHGDELLEATDQENRSPHRGCLLASDRLLAALRTPDRIFREGSWEPKQIKGAGYELRLAGDLLVLPVKPGVPDYRTVPKGGIRVDEFTLAPGDSALISTQEKFSMDFDVSCLIGPKFRWSAKGLLVLQGMVAHPGYGREQNALGQWVPKDDERLYLVIANIGPADIHMRCGDPIAYVQFFDVEPSSERKAVDNFGVRSATDNVVVFGVFLVSSTILGFVLTTLVGLVQRFPEGLALWKVIVIAGLVALYAALTVASVIIVARAARRVTQMQAPVGDRSSSNP